MPRSTHAAVLPVPPIVAGFFTPFSCGGSSGFLSGLFFGGIICHPPILSYCVGLLAPSRNRRRTIPLLQGPHMACTGRFLGVASCTTSGILCRPGQRGGPWRHRPGGRPRRSGPEFGSGQGSELFRQGRGGKTRAGEWGIVASHSRFESRWHSRRKSQRNPPKVARPPGGIFIVAIVD